MPRKPGIYRKVKTLSINVMCYDETEDKVIDNYIIVPFNSYDDNQLLNELKKYFSTNLIPLKIINKQINVDNYRMDYITFINHATKLN